jgi:transcription termination/antitermination protein NusG
MSLSWYVVQVATNMEDRVQSAIVNSIVKKLLAYQQEHKENKVSELKNAFGITGNLKEEYEWEEFLHENTILVPKEKVEEIKNGKKREIDRKIFPGYVLIRMDYNDDVGLLVRKTPKVAGFVGVAKDSRPVPVPQREIDNILRQVEQSKEQAKHKVEFEVGEKIHVIDGPFVDFNAIIEDVIYAKSKLKVNVQIFGRDTPVELDFGQVEKIF